MTDSLPLVKEFNEGDRVTVPGGVAGTIIKVGVPPYDRVWIRVELRYDVEVNFLREHVVHALLQDDPPFASQGPHACPTFSSDPGWAIEEIKVDSELRAFAGNSEYLTEITFCPFCGERIGRELPKRGEA